MRIMIVDDASFIRLALGKILMEDHHEIVGEAATGVEAIETYKKVRPDLVTMDITMPDMDGIDALRGILAFDPDAKVVMCSAMGQQTKVFASIEAGAKDFIVKPFEADRVKEAVRKLAM